MAIVRSLGVGEGKKSAGMLTYRSVRGRTIASRRIISNASNTPLQANQRSTFGDAAKFMLFILAYIEGAFEKSKFGSARNNYVKSNPNIAEWGGVRLLNEVSENTISVGDALMSSNIDLSLGQKPGIAYVSRGSAGGVQVVPRDKINPKATFGPDTIIGENNVYNGVEFRFPMGARPEDIGLTVYTFYQSTLQAPDYTTYTAAEFGQGGGFDDGLSSEVDSNGLITSITLVCDKEQIVTDAVVIPVVKYRGKIVSSQVMTAVVTPPTSGGDVLP